MTSPILADTTRDGRVYTHPISGETFDSVTSILQVIAKPALIGWTAKTVAAYAVEHASVWQELDAAAAVDLIKGSSRRHTNSRANVGSAVHKAVELWTGKGEHDLSSLAGDVRPYVNQFRQWLKDYKPVFHLSEATVFNSKYSYAGTTDAVVTIPGFGLYVIDYKTSRSGIYPETALQLAAYAKAETYVIRDDGGWYERPMYDVVGAAALHLTPDRYRFVPCDIGTQTFIAFRAARYLHRWQQEQAASSVGDHRPPPQKAVR